MNPMRLTAVVLLILGSILTLFAVAALYTPDVPVTATSPDEAGPPAPSAVVLLPFAGVAFALGIGLFLFRDRGAIRTRNPIHRN